MSKNVMTLAVAAVMALGSGATAQMPGGPPAAGMNGPGRGPGGDGPASMLLSNTGELKLTDAQVTRLAGIARRSADRRTAMRASMDTMRTNMMRQIRDTGRRAMPPQLTATQRASMEKMRTSQHEDLRDALAVLNPDQQASAFEMMARRGNRGGGMQRGQRGRMGRMNGGMRRMSPGGPPGNMTVPDGRGGNGMRPRSPDGNQMAPTRRPAPTRTPQSEP